MCLRPFGSMLRALSGCSFDREACSIRLQTHPMHDLPQEMPNMKPLRVSIHCVCRVASNIEKCNLKSRLSRPGSRDRQGLAHRQCGIPHIELHASEIAEYQLAWHDFLMTYATERDMGMMDHVYSWGCILARHIKISD